MISKIPSLWLSAYADLHTHKLLCAQSADDILQAIVASCAALLADAKLSWLQVNVILDDS